MPRVLLTSYTFKLSRTNGSYFPASKLFGPIEGYFRKNASKKIKLNTNGRDFVFEVTDLNVNKKDRIIEGIIKTGDYGYEAELYNITTGATRTRTKDDAELLPFYFLFYFPANKQADKGIALLQRIYPYGIKSLLNQSLDNYFKRNPPASLPRRFRSCIRNERFSAIQSI